MKRATLVCPLLFCFCSGEPALAASGAMPLRFDFGDGGAAEGFVEVQLGDRYDPDRGYGFEDNGKRMSIRRATRAAGVEGDFVTGADGFVFSVAVPEGNYRVTVILGDADGQSRTSVLAETRRWMLEDVSTKSGEIVRQSFVVNVRTPVLQPPPRFAPGGVAVNISETEKQTRTWDEKLTLEFTGPEPKVCGVEIERVEVPTIFLLGDSTVTDQAVAPSASWGQMLPQFFSDAIAVANHAWSGETMKSSLANMRVAKALEQLRPGDYVFIQFGHNDQKRQWPQTFVDAATTYRDYMRALVDEVRLRGATPVLVTSMQRRKFDGDRHIINTHGSYPDAVRAVAAEMNVVLVDLHQMSTVLYEALGPERAPLAFANGGRDATHHNEYGALQLAKCVVEAIRRSRLPLKLFLWAGLPHFDPARPDQPGEPTAADAVDSVSAQPGADRRPALFIAGDSTAARAPADSGRQGWGEPFRDFFDETRVRVENRARGGRSSRTFITEGHWAKLLGEIRPGDVVLIQFGHNDVGAINAEPPGSDRPTRARGSLPGIGGERVVIDNVVTGKRETVYSFGWYLRRMIADVRDRGATPVLLAPTVRNIWAASRIERGIGRIAGWTYAVALETDTPFLDVTNTVADRFEKMGEEVMANLYRHDHTHFNESGARMHAEAVVALLQGLRPNRVESWLSAAGRAVEPDLSTWLSLPVPADRALPTLWLIGDSTVRNGRGDGANGEWGWGDFVGRFFDTRRINVVNRAVGGLSSRTFRTQGYWERVFGMLQPGDFIVMQFGHNDSGPINDDRRARGTLSGVGDEKETINNLLTGRSEIVHTYGWYLRQYIREARARGAVPIVCSPVPRKIWKDGLIDRGDAARDYPAWARRVAAEEKSGLVDLNEIIARAYERLGPASVEHLFADEHTHTSGEGADLNAASFVEGLVALSPECELASYLAIPAR